MHPIHHTEGFILGGVEKKEADKLLFVLTKDFGLISVYATGIRKISSKLRFVTQDFSYASIDLVVGREYFKLTSASRKEDTLSLVSNQDIYELLSRISSFVKRFCRGQEQNEELYQSFFDFYMFIFSIEKNEQKFDPVILEIGCVIKILKILGYVGEGEHSQFLDIPFSNEFLSKISEQKTFFLSEINRAFKESHL